MASLVGASLLLLVGTSPARADDGPPADLGAGASDEPAAVFGALPELVVEAPTLTRRPLFETTTGVNLIGRRDLVRLQPRAAADVFSWRPGLWNTQGSAGHMGTPVIRGLTGN